MGKMASDNGTTDSSDDERRKIIHAEKKVRTKKKKRKRDLTDLHQRLMKSKKQNRLMECKLWQSNFTKLLHRFSDRREEYDKETKIDGKLDKRNPKTICKRILPRPLAGIYRNGAVGKKIRRFQTKPPMNDINNARLQGNVLKLLYGYDSKSEIVVLDNNATEASERTLTDPTLKNLLQVPCKNGISPILGKLDGKKRNSKSGSTDNIAALKYVELPHRPQEKTKINSNNLRSSAINKYEELCNIVSSENFEEQNFLSQFTDPLPVLKNKLRNAYAETFRNQFLRDMIKRGTILKGTQSPGCVFENEVPTETDYSPSNYKYDTEFIANGIKNPARHNNCTFSAPKTNLLFDVPLMSEVNACTDVENIVDTDSAQRTVNTVFEENSSNVNLHNQINIEENHNYRKNNVNYLEKIPVCLHRIKKAIDTNEPVVFLPTETELSNNLVGKQHSRRQKNQYTQTSQLLTSRIKKHPGKNNVKVSQQVKIKNLKHIPAILRKCKDKSYLFDKSVRENKETKEVLIDTTVKKNVLFTPHSLIVESNKNPVKLGDFKQRLNAQTCPISSPTLINNDVRFIQSFCLQTDEKHKPQNVDNNDIFMQRKNVNSSAQKTIMFTRKDFSNIGHCLHINNLIASSQKYEKSMRNNCAGHSNYYRSYDRSQDSHNSNSQECLDSNLPSQMQQEPVICEKVLLRRVHQPQYKTGQEYCQKDQRVRYVVVDQCTDQDNVQRLQNCSNSSRPYQIERHKTIQNDHFCEEDVSDVGILKGVQNLKIFPMEEQKSQMNAKSNQYIGDTVVLEEQPIKYLAFESESKTKRVPIYLQRDNHVAPVDNLEIVDPKVNYRIISCPQKTSQKVILLPACEQNKVVYVKEKNSNPANIAFEECSHPRKVILYRPDFQSNIQCVNDSKNQCEVHISNQNLVKIKKSELETVALNLQTESEKNNVNWEGLLYRPSHGQPIVNDACARSKTVFYRK